MAALIARHAEEDARGELPAGPLHELVGGNGADKHEDVGEGASHRGEE